MPRRSVRDNSTDQPQQPSQAGAHGPSEGQPTSPRRAAKATEATAAAPARRRVDWDAVDRDYRAGTLTVRELATKHGTDHATIVRRAKRLGLTRDLSDAVREATNARLIADTITKEVTSRVTKSHQEVTSTVMAAAEVNARVIMGHRGELGQARALANALLVELQQAALTEDDQQLLAEVLAGDNAKPADLAKARSAVARAIGLGGRVTSMRALGETFARLQAAERAAYGIEQAPRAAEDPMDVLLKGLGRSVLPVVGPSRDD